MNWTIKQRKFMDWLSLPSDERLPTTEKSFAEDIGVSVMTLWRWKQLPGFYAEVNKLVDEHFGDDYAPIVEAFKREARNGSYQHQKTYFEMLGKYMPKQQVEVTGGVNVYMPDNQREDKPE
jgi:hypothetical protein